MTEATAPPLPGAASAIEPPVESMSGPRLLALLNDWWFQARDAHAENRSLQALDAAFYDHEQWSLEELAVLAKRHQAPSVYNKIKQVVDWLIGTERRTRLDWRISPRGPSDTEIAKAKQGFMKYLDDVNGFSWERSKAFADAVKVGIGWTEETITLSTDKPPVLLEHESWRNMWLDPQSRHQELTDARFLTRGKTLDLDYGQAMFPQHAEALRMQSMESSRFMLDMGEDIEETDQPQALRHADRWGRTALSSSSQVGLYGDRRRVRIYETWYRHPESAKRISAPYHPQLHGVWFDPTNPAQVELQKTGVISLADTVRQRVRFAIWVKGTLLKNGPSPFKHDKFPFTPFWGFRKDRDGMPYGVVRGIRDPQIEYNKRASKALFHLSANQLIASEDAFADWDEAVEQAAKPDGVLKVKKGMAADVRIERGAELAAAQVQLMEIAAAHIHDGSGVNREQLGRESNATSGRAIIAKQTEGAVTTAELFDNYRLSVKLSGQKTLSLTEQYVTGPQVFRVTEDRGALQWIEINKPVVDPETGLITYENDITASQADFVVDQQDFRETQRQAMAEQLMETIGQLPPEMGIQLLDLAIDLTDIPGKAEIVKRIRSINGQADPTNLDSPEAQMAQQQAEQQRAADAAMAQRERTAAVSQSEAQTEKLRADTAKIRVDTQSAAMNTAGLIAGALPLAQTADQVLLSAEPPQVHP